MHAAGAALAPRARPHAAAAAAAVAILRGASCTPCCASRWVYMLPACCIFCARGSGALPRPPPPSRGPPRTHCTHRQLGGARHGPRVHIMVYTQIPTFPAVQPARARARQVPAAGARRAPLPPAAPPAAPPPLTATAPPPRRSPPPPRCSSPRLLAGGRRNTASAAVREQNRHGTIYLSTQHAFIDRAHRP